MVRKFQAIEITSRCNLSCKYCPHPKMTRSKQDMTEDTFRQVLFWLRRFNQDILHFQMIGESTLHPKLCDFISMSRLFVPVVNLSTNGVGVTKEMLLSMKRAGLGRLTVSIHRPEVAQKVIQLCNEINLPSEWGTGPINNHTWAGQVDTPNLSDRHPNCEFLASQEAVVLSDGRVVACCMDAEGISSRGLSVWNDLTQVVFRPYKLCLSCHHKVSNLLFPDWREELEKNPDRPAAGKRVSLQMIGGV